MTKACDSDFIPLPKAQTQLSFVWFIGCGVIFMILLVASFGNVFEGQLQEVWSASLPTLLPTLALILSVLGATAIVERNKSGQEAEDDKVETFVRRDFYRITFALSVGYLLLILLSFFVHPFLTWANSPPVTSQDVLDALHASNQAGEVKAQEGPSAADVIVMSNLWLAPVQGLVVGAMGVLFFTKSK